MSLKRSRRPYPGGARGGIFCLRRLLACLAGLLLALPPSVATAAQLGSVVCLAATSACPSPSLPADGTLAMGTGPSVGSIDPTEGPVGTTIVVTGGGLTTTQAVYFGSSQATDLNVVSDLEVMASAPSGTGTVDVTVLTANGTSLPEPHAKFTYTAPPAPTQLGAVTTPDGTFSLAIPPGPTTAPTVDESCGPLANLPAHAAAVGCLYDLSGPPLVPPGTLTLGYAPSKLNGIEPGRLSVYALAGSAGWTAVPTEVNADEGVVTAAVSGPEVLVLLGDTQQFPDLAQTTWAKPSVDTLLAAGILSGFPDGTFRPEAPLTRAEFVKMLALAEGLLPGDGQTPFADVPGNAWFAPYVSAAVGAQLVKGLTPTTFGPDQPVTREEAAVLLTRALHLTASVNLHAPDLGDIDAWALPAVEAAVAAGYLHGFPDGTFRPVATTTRAEAAVVLAGLWTRGGQ